MNSEKLKTWLNFSKFFLGTFVLGIAAVLVNYHIQSQEVLLKAEEVKLKKEEFKLATLEKTSAIELAELKSLGDYIDYALEEKVAIRRRFSQYFATVTRSPELRHRWEEYDKLVKLEFESFQRQQIVAESDLQDLKQALAGINVNDIGKRFELEQIIGQLTAKLEEIERELRIKTITTARQIGGGPLEITIYSRGETVYGQMLCCAIKRSVFPDETYAITTRVPTIQNAAGFEVRVLGQRLGIVQAIHGFLQNEKENNLDAMLIRVQDDDLLKLALGGVIYTGFAQSRSDIPSKYWLLSSEGPVRLRHTSIKRNTQLDYGMVGRERIVHKALLESRSARPVSVGSSGTPIASGKSGGMLLGMLIASDSETVLAIPAWQLFRPELYVGMSTQEKLVLQVPSKEPSTDRSSE